jgi:uncharacterized protein with FMN-binding domain
MFEKIVSTQSPSVDTITGATYSCKGIIEAVEDALNQSSGTLSSNSTTSSDSSNEKDSDSSSSKKPARKSKSNNSTTTTTPSTDSKSTTNSKSATSNIAPQSYEDGTYTGTGTGFKGGTTKIAVTVQGGKISKVETVSHEDTPKFYQRIENTMLNKILSTQSTNVDTVSGATYSCRGIIEATESALSQAK